MPPAPDKAAQTPGSDLSGLLHVAVDLAGFRHAPKFNQRHAEALLEVLMVLWIDPRPQSDAGRMIPVIGLLRLVQQHGRHHAQVMKGRSPGLANVLPPGGWVKAIRRNQAIARQHRARRGYRKRVHVEKRQRIEDALLARFQRRRAAHRQITIAGAEEIEICQNASLGPAGSA